MPNAKMYWLHALSPTHVGAGRGIGYIDLPLHRDKVTNWPLIPGSAFKGVWRDWAVNEKKPHIEMAFGKASDREKQESNAGALVPTDARLVCLPIRSFAGTFAWCTSPMCLRMLKRDLRMAYPNHSLPDLTVNKENGILVTGPTLIENNKVYLEDLDLEVESKETADTWAKFIAERVFAETAWEKVFKDRFAVLPDAVFDFLTETGTQVDARVTIDPDSKTVVDGMLWNEESLPPETILAGFVACDRVFGNGITPKDLLDQFATTELALQIGGKATVGRGRVRCVFGGSE